MHTVECLQPVEAAKRIVCGSRIPIDVAEVKTGKELIYSINIIGWGLVTDIGITAENYRWMGESRYTLISMLEIFRLKQRSAKLIINETEEMLPVIHLGVEKVGTTQVCGPGHLVNSLALYLSTSI